MYYGKYPNDPLVKAKMNEKTRFFLSDPSMQPSIATQFVEEGRTPETSMTPQVQPNMLTGTGDLTEEEQEALSSPLNPWTSDDSDLPLSSLKGSTTSQW